MSATAASLSKTDKADAKTKAELDRKSRFAAIQALSDQNAILLQRYRDHQKLKQDKEMANLSEKEKNDLKNTWEMRLENFPNLKKFIEDKEGPDNEKNKLLIDCQCPKLERSLFHAIEARNIDFVTQLLELGANPNITISGNDIVRITPVYYALLEDNHYSKVFLESPNARYAHQPIWSPSDSAKRANLIFELIIRGAIIDDPTLLGVKKESFLNRLMGIIVHHPEFLPVFNIALEFNQKVKDKQLNIDIHGHNGLTPLMCVVRTIVLTFKNRHIETSDKNDTDFLDLENRIKIIEAEVQYYKNVIKALIKAGPNYQINNMKTFDWLVAELENCSKFSSSISEAVLPLFSLVFDDMAEQCLEQFLELPYREYRDKEHFLMVYAWKQYHQEITYDPYSKDLVVSYDDDGDPIDPWAVHIQEKIVKPALRMLEERYSLGFASAACHHYLSPDKYRSRIETGTALASLPTIKEFDLTAANIWNIVIEYCYPKRLSPYLYDAYHMGLHFDLSPYTLNSANSPSLVSMLSSYQLVALETNVFRTIMESHPPYSADPVTDAELYNRGAYSSAIVRATPKASTNIVVHKSRQIFYSTGPLDIKELAEKCEYHYRFVAKGQGGCYGMRVHRFIVQPSFQKGTTVVQCLNGERPDSAFLFLLQDKRNQANQTPLFNINMAWKHKEVADELDSNGVYVSDIVEERTFEAFAKDKLNIMFDDMAAAVSKTANASAAVTLNTATATAATDTASIATANAATAKRINPMTRTGTSLLSFYEMVAKVTDLASKAAKSTAQTAATPGKS